MNKWGSDLEPHVAPNLGRSPAPQLRQQERGRPNPTRPQRGLRLGGWASFPTRAFLSCHKIPMSVKTFGWFQKPLTFHLEALREAGTPT